MRCPIEQIGTVAGFAIIVVCQTLEVFIFPDIFNDVPNALYIAEFLLPLLGLSLGFGFASLFGLPYSIRRTIAIEAGIQNVGTALTIITLSFPFEVRTVLLIRLVATKVASRQASLLVIDPRVAEQDK